MDAWWDTTCASRKARTLSRRTYWRFKRNLESRSSSCGMTGFENLRLLYSSSSTRTRVSRSQFRTLIKLAGQLSGPYKRLLPLDAACYTTQNWTNFYVARLLCSMQESAPSPEITNNIPFKVVDRSKPSIKHMWVFGVELTFYLQRKSGSSRIPSIELAYS